MGKTQRSLFLYIYIYIYPFIVPPVLLQTISTLRSLLMACRKCIQWVILLLLSSITTDWVWLLIFTRFLDHTQRRTTVISTSQRPLPDNTQQSQQTNIHAPRHAEDFYLPLKIRRLRPGLNPRTWVPKASTLPLDHRSRWQRSLCTEGHLSGEQLHLPSVRQYASHIITAIWYKTTIDCISTMALVVPLSQNTVSGCIYSTDPSMQGTLHCRNIPFCIKIITPASKLQI